MFSYAAKRILRGRSLFLAFFLTIVLAATLFSGILQGADAIGVSMLDRTLTATSIDIVSGVQQRNLTRTNYEDVEAGIRSIKMVSGVDHLIRMEARVNTTLVNATLPFIVVGISGDSPLLNGISGLDRLETGKVYIDRGSVNASLFNPGEKVSLSVLTYFIFGTIADFEYKYFDHVVGGLVETDDSVFSIATGRYILLLRSLLLGSEETERRPPHQIIYMNDETLRAMLDKIYEEMRAPAGENVLIAEITISLDRGALITPWDIQESSKRVRQVLEQVNSVGATHGYVPVNYLGSLLEFIEANSSGLKTSTTVVAAPAFFIAWYLGITVSEVSLGLRRREIGLLLTRGLTPKQVYSIFLFEAFIISLLAGALGVLIGGVFIPVTVVGMGAQKALGALSPITVAASLVFSGALALLVIITPARKASRTNLVESLTEFREEESATGSWQEPLLALFFGGYKIAMLALGVNIESFRPDASNFVVYMLYSTWWGLDYILTYVGPILFFWGLTRLMIVRSGWFHGLVERLGEALMGDLASISMLNARRNMRRTVASAFMIALIFGYGVTVIGNVENAKYYMEQVMKLTVGADVSVWLFSGKSVGNLTEKIASVDGVSAATVETWFTAESSLGIISVRAIDPLKWKDIAYLDLVRIEGANPLETMNRSGTAAIMEKGAAEQLNILIGDKLILRLGADVHNLTITGIFEWEPGIGWSTQNPIVYVPEAFIEQVDEEDITQTRVLLRLDGGVSPEKLVSTIEALDTEVDSVNVANEILGQSSSNIYLSGSRRVQELGIYFAASMSSVGVALVMYTVLRSRWKELNIMSTRGLSFGQLSGTLILENISMTIFAIFIGLVVGFVSLRGEISLFNSAILAAPWRGISFPPSAQLQLAVMATIVLFMTSAPILIAARRISNRPMWAFEE